MQRLITRDVVPPSDNEGRMFRYTHLETGHVTVAPVYYDWIERARKHRTANNLPIPDDFEAQMEDQLCQSLPPEWCDRTGGQSWVSTRFGLDDFINGMKAFGRLMLGGFDFVSRAEADRRSRICSNCYYNVNLPGCTGCQKLASYITGDVAKRTTAYDERLKACSVCKCALKAMVHFPMDALETSDTPEKQALYPSEFCWKSHQSPNYLPNEQDGQVVSREAHNLESRVRVPVLQNQMA